MPTSGALLLALLLAPPPVVERILAVVDGRPLLLSEVRALQAVRGTSGEQALDLLVDEILMYDQASRTPQAAVTPTEEEKARAALLEKRPELAAEVTSADLGRLLRRQLSILKYVGFRFQPQVRPSEEELLAAYAEQYEDRPEAPAFDTVIAALRTRLERQKLDQKLEDWVAELRKDADIRRNPPPRGEP